MAPLGGLMQAIEEPPLWVALITGVLGVIGARKAKDRVDGWARQKYGSGDEVIQALRGIERSICDEGEATRHAIRVEGDATRKCIRDEGAKTQATLAPVATGVARILGRQEGHG